MTEVLPEIDTELSEFDNKSHYVRIAALIQGGPIVALCGKKWIPQHIADAGKFPKCLSCQDLMDVLIMMDPNAPKRDL